MANAAFFAILTLVVIAAVRISLATRDVLPQIPDLDGFPDIPTHQASIEEVGRMNVEVPPIIAPTAPPSRCSR